MMRVKTICPKCSKDLMTMNSAEPPTLVPKSLPHLRYCWGCDVVYRVKVNLIIKRIEESMKP